MSFDAVFADRLKGGSSLVFEGMETPMKAWVLAKASLELGKDILILTGEGQEESRPDIRRSSTSITAMRSERC